LAQEQGFPLETAEVSPGGATPYLPGDTRVLWDSLLLDGLANYPADRSGVRHGLLVHYVPFLNPLLDAERRKAETRRFDRAAQRAEFFIATGRSVRQLLERRYPGKPIFLA